MRSPKSGPAGPPETLADVLASGPLSMPAGLRCACEIATELRDLHQQNRAYGKLTAHSVIMTESGARLVPLRHYWDEAVPEADVQAFGALFYEILAGTAPPATLKAADIRLRGPLTGAARVRPAAIRLALKCREERGAGLTMQQVATGIRLLGVLLRQYEGNPRPGQAPHPRTPFLIKPSPPVAAPAGNSPTSDPDTDLPDEAFETDSEESLAAVGGGVAPLVPLERDSFGHPEPKPQADPLPDVGKCPKCASTAIYVSHARTGFERQLERWGVPLCRCHRCSHRYVVFARMRFAKQLPRGSRRKKY